MLVAKTCDGCSAAPLTQYKNNEIYQEITKEDKFADNDTDDKIYIDMRRSKGYTDELEKLNCDDSGLAVTIGLKEAAARKGLPYIYKNKVYLGKRLQSGTGAVSRVIARLLENVGDVIEL